MGSGDDDRRVRPGGGGGRLLGERFGGRERRIRGWRHRRARFRVGRRSRGRSAGLAGRPGRPERDRGRKRQSDPPVGGDGRKARKRPAEEPSGAAIGRHQDRRRRPAGRSQPFRPDTVGGEEDRRRPRRLRDAQLDERIEDPQRPDHDPRPRAGVQAGDGRHRGHRPRPRDRRERHRAGREPAVRRPPGPAREPRGAGEGAPAAHGPRRDDLGVDPGRELSPAGRVPDRGRPGPHALPPEPHVDVDDHRGAARGGQEAGPAAACERPLEGR